MRSGQANKQEVLQVSPCSLSLLEFMSYHFLISGVHGLYLKVLKHFTFSYDLELVLNSHTDPRVRTSSPKPSLTFPSLVYSNSTWVSFSL